MAERFVRYPHPALLRGAAARPVDAALHAVGERLRAAAAEVEAYGLAGAHIGEPAPVVVVNMTPGTAPSYRLFYNPQIIDNATEIAVGPEGSVSLPGVRAEIARPVWAEIGFDDEAGRRRQERFDGLVARCLLHEIEQMNGRFFLMNLSRLKRDRLLRKARHGTA